MDDPVHNEMAELIRAAFIESGLSRFELARRAKVSYGGLHPFMGGARDITLATATRLCRELNLELRPVRRRKKGHK